MWNIFGIMTQVLSKYIWFFNQAGGRFIHLQQVFNGLKLTGIPWIEFDGTTIYPFCAVDDLGMYWIVPQLALFFNVSLESAVKIIFWGMPVAAWLIGLIGLFCLYPNFVQRFISFVGLTALLGLLLYIGDIYIFYGITGIALLPWALYLAQAEREVTSYILFGFCTGFAISFAHYMRAHSGIASLLFIGAVIFGSSIIARKIKIKFLLALLFGSCIIPLFINQQLIHYNDYVQQHCEPIMLKHQFWSTVYCGLGFLKFMNKFNIKWDDSCAENKLQQLRKENPGIEDEILMRNEIIKLFKEERFFIIFTLFSKLGVLLLFLLLCANFGLVVTLLAPLSPREYLGFLAALGFSSIFPLVAMPFLTYGLGFITYAILFGIVSINHATGRFIELRSNFPHAQHAKSIDQIIV